MIIHQATISFPLLFSLPVVVIISNLYQEAKARNVDRRFQPWALRFRSVAGQRVASSMIVSTVAGGKHRRGRWLLIYGIAAVVD